MAKSIEEHHETPADSALQSISPMMAEVILSYKSHEGIEPMDADEQVHLHKRYWSGGVTTPANPFRFDGAYISFLDDAYSAGHSPYEVCHGDSFTQCFGLGNPGLRLVEFIFRGRGDRRRSGPQWFEVLLIESGEERRLGPLFGIDAYACVVVAGVNGVRDVSFAWLSGKNLEQVLQSAQFHDRQNPAEPLTLSSLT